MLGDDVNEAAIIHGQEGVQSKETPPNSQILAYISNALLNVIKQQEFQKQINRLMSTQGSINAMEDTTCSNVDNVNSSAYRSSQALSKSNDSQVLQADISQHDLSSDENNFTDADLDLEFRHMCAILWLIRD